MQSRLNYGPVCLKVGLSLRISVKVCHVTLKKKHMSNGIPIRYLTTGRQTDMIFEGVLFSFFFLLLQRITLSGLFPFRINLKL
jgi:hypothetical protein